MSYKIELEKKEIDRITDSLSFRLNELKRRIDKTKNLNSKKSRDNNKEAFEIDKLLEDLYKIDKSFSKGILFGLYK